MGSSRSVLSFKHHSRSLNPLWDLEKIFENWHFDVSVLLCNIVQLRGAVFFFGAATVAAVARYLPRI